MILKIMIDRYLGTKISSHLTCMVLNVHVHRFFHIKNNLIFLQAVHIANRDANSKPTFDEIPIKPGLGRQPNLV